MDETGLFDTAKEDRRAYVAEKLALDLNAPEAWPLNLIDDIIRQAEKAAEAKLDECVRARNKYNRR